MTTGIKTSASAIRIDGCDYALRSNGITGKQLCELCVTRMCTSCACCTRYRSNARCLTVSANLLLAPYYAVGQAGMTSGNADRHGISLSLCRDESTLICQQPSFGLRDANCWCIYNMQMIRRLCRLYLFMKCSYKCNYTSR